MHNSTQTARKLPKCNDPCTPFSRARKLMAQSRVLPNQCLCRDYLPSSCEVPELRRSITQNCCIFLSRCTLWLPSLNVFVIIKREIFPNSHPSLPTAWRNYDYYYYAAAATATEPCTKGLWDADKAKKRANWVEIEMTNKGKHSCAAAATHIFFPFSPFDTDGPQSVRCLCGTRKV